MSQTLPEGASILPADIERIAIAYRDLVKSKGAHGSLMVKVNLHAHYEYPKHLHFGAETVVVNNEIEEVAARTAHAPAIEPEPEVEVAAPITESTVEPEPLSESSETSDGKPSGADLDTAVATIEEETKAKEATKPPSSKKPVTMKPAK